VFAKRAFGQPLAVGVGESVDRVEPGERLPVVGDVAHVGVVRSPDDALAAELLDQPADVVVDVGVGVSLVRDVGGLGDLHRHVVLREIGQPGEIALLGRARRVGAREVVDEIGQLRVAIDQFDHLVELGIVDEDLADSVLLDGGLPERRLLHGVVEPLRGGVELGPHPRLGTRRRQPETEDALAEVLAERAGGVGFERIDGHDAVEAIVLAGDAAGVPVVPVIGQRVADDDRLVDPRLVHLAEQRPGVVDDGRRERLRDLQQTAVRPRVGRRRRPPGVGVRIEHHARRLRVPERKRSGAGVA